MAAVELRYGYTLDTLDRLAKTVVVANAQWWPGGDRHQQIDTAWSGIAEALYAAEHEPSENELLQAGTRALVEDTKAYRKHHGLRDGGLVGDGPRFAAFWYDPPNEPWEDRLIDRIAIGQIMPTLKPHLAETVGALATLGDYAAAADAVGVKYGALTMRMREARQAFQRQWYAPDAPPPTRGTDRRVGSYARPPRTHCSEGHELTPENTYRRPNPKPGRRGERVCKTCEAKRSQRRVAARKVAA